MSNPLHYGLPVLLVGGKSGGIVGFCRVPQVRAFAWAFGAAAGLCLAALQVFPQRRLKALVAPLFFGFRTVRHAR